MSIPLSPTGALLVALVALLLLACLAGWLLNVPLWVIAVFAALGGLLIRRTFRRFLRQRPRQEAETSKN